MIKAILMIYVFVFSMGVNIGTDQFEARLISIGVAFGAGMFCMMFIHRYAAEIASKPEPDQEQAQ